MPYFKSTIEVIVEVDDYGSACDAMAEAIRPMLKEFYDGDHETAWVDWQYVTRDGAITGPEPYTPRDGDGFEYVERVTV